MVAAKMKVPCCSVCHTRYNEDERVPLLLQCGHGFCKDCLSKMFSSSSDTSLACPRCRHVSVVGNSVQGLRKNFAMLALVGGGNFDCDYTDSDEDDEDDGDDGGAASSSRLDKSSSCGPVIEVGAHPEMKLVKRIGEDGSGGVEMWDATVAGGGGRCKHRVAVKKMCLTEDMDVDWMQGQLESLRKASMWCRNVCTFHGVVKMDGSMCLLMDRCYGSVQSEMERNEGRLTLEQILRYGADVARGVAELHAAGVICMNIKPSNLLLDASGNAVVSDYGLAPILKKPICQKTRPEFDSSKITPYTDCVTLSPHYTAPEAWGPVKKLFWEDASGVSPESDAWSFGCTLVEMCTGSTPWDGLSREEIFQAVVKARKVPPQYERIVGVGIPRELWKMIGECLQFKPSKRPTFNAMLATFLRHLQEIPRSPSASPDNGFIKVCGVNVVEEPRATNMGVLPDNPINLHRVVLEGDSEGVRNILAKAATGSGGSSVRFLLEAQNADGQSALHLACRRGSVELVEAILEYGEANVDIVDKDGDPPLVFALAAGSPQCVHVLIKKGANVRSRLREGSGPSVAHVCSYHGQPDCMRELLVAGADPNAVDDEGETVLHRAVTKKYTDCAIVILENGGSRSMAVSNGKGLTPLHMCVSTWNVAVIKRWVEVSSPEEISQAINIPSPVGTALCMAAAIRKDHEKEGRELVQILLAAGADPTAQDAQHGRTALHTAAMANNVELVRVILDAGVNANIRNVHNTIPLHMALARGANACVSLLLESGSDCNIQDDEGDNALHIAADAAKMIRENLDWLIVMLKRPDAAVDVRNHSGKTVRDFLEALPREWISEDLMEALLKRGVHLSPTIYEIGDWVKFKRRITTPLHGWQGAKPKSVGFVQTILEKEDMIVAFCSGEAHVLASEVVKLIPLDRGQHVRLRKDVKEPRFGWRGQSRDSVGTVLCVDEDGILRVGFPGASRGWKADPAEMERVEEFKVGDWVRIRQNLTSAKHGFGSVVPGSMGIVYCVRPDSSLLVELSYLPNPWHCEPEEVEPATPFRIGDRVCVKRSVAEPRYAWGGETHHSVGKISEIENDGLLIIEIPNRPIPWQADPSDMEKIDDFKVGDWVRVKASVSSPKYGWEDITRNSIGVMHSSDEDGDVGIAFCFRSKPFSCSVTDVEKVVPFHVGQEIHMIPSIAQPRLGWSNETPATIGKIMRIDMDGTLSAQVTGRQTLWKVSPGDAEMLSGFEVGDWVRSKPSLGSRPSYDWFSVGRDSIAVVHSIQEAGYLELACCFRKGRWSTHYTDLEKIPSLKAGQFVHFQKGLTEPRWGWRGAKPDSRGIITTVHADGEVRVAFFGLPGLWKGDPADLEVERMFEVGEWVRLKEGVPSWKSIGPGSVGVVHGVGYEGDEWDGTISVSFCGEQERWTGSFTHLDKAKKLVVGQKTRVKLAVKQPRFGWSGHSHGSVGTIAAIDADGKLRIYTPAGSKTWMLDPSEVETIEEEELKIGNWVRVKPSITTPTYQWGEVNPSSIGVIHRMEDGDLWVSFCFLDRLWLCKAVEMERIRPFGIGDKVKIKNGLVTPRWGWGMETHASKGHVVGVDANGKLRIKFLWREGRPWIGDPADIVLDEPSG
ncbi:E3 ubiquitin-protein ligase KEG isoform X1 [Brassica napus]|uniref:E3 ubiquitin-protein ligase KEG isoform X1 n=1 Tax=Brassica oleracea var. oleracea TaxID=109376 RepID=UPI0006A751A6|nr:PREDICTED: E3 ubiquitin-protein ligase KEG isoform X1 [Brassica oleracea var. oleracea]XP_013728211.3 E3 ubiquitin-protein ligase KEG isoform X1 [Brassica napus]